ncbi:MAG TPA: FTR1 family protein [archaeon]|nr:FTR1 family protein [archaeon]HLD81095.1 FTR1 family protein [archaeon]
MVSIDAFLVVLRESLEAFLILSILFGVLVKTGRREGEKYLLAGALLALALSIATGIAVDAVARDFFESSGSAEAFEGVASLAAVIVLTYMVVWMYQHTLGLASAFHGKAVNALSSGNHGALFALAFLAVAREGLETVLFFAALAPTTTFYELTLSAALGLAASAVASFLLFSGVIRLSISKFFAVSGALLALFAAGLLATSVHEFAEIGVLPETGKAWDTEWLLDQQSALGGIAEAVLGYRESPDYLEVAAYASYLTFLGVYSRGALAAKKRVKP